MESQPEGMHPEHRQFRQYVVRGRTGRNHLRIRVIGETLNVLYLAITKAIRGERNQIDSFWHSYLEVGRAASTTCDEQLLELTDPHLTKESDYDLRPATPDELEQAVSMNVELALAERGNDPLKLDPAGFRQRLLRRILRKQVWVWVRHGKVIFKAEVITRTPDVVYLEGLYVHRDERRKGHGLRSMRQLGNIL